MQLTEQTYFGDNNRYFLIKLLGRGGFSEVWLAKDSVTELEIAIKVYAPGTGMDEDGLKIFSKELAQVYNLNHSNLLKPQHVDSWQGMPYLVMSYCSKGSLVKRIGNMTEEEVWKVIREVASGLAYLHERDIIHQDIKPDNILMDEQGHYVITDFGISTRARSTLRKSVAASSSSAAGTLAYMGPERFGKEPTPIKASDIWSLGAMVFELLTGSTPFGEHGGLIQKSGADIPNITGDYSPNLIALVEKMLSEEPWDRPTALFLSNVDLEKISFVSKETSASSKTQMLNQDNADSKIPSSSYDNSNRKSRVYIWLISSLILGTLGYLIYTHNQKRIDHEEQIRIAHEEQIREERIQFEKQVSELQVQITGDKQCVEVGDTICFLLNLSDNCIVQEVKYYVGGAMQYGNLYSIIASNIGVHRCNGYAHITFLNGQEKDLSYTFSYTVAP